ncbi:MAG: O-antigen ligase family protein [Gammaproteobacteria bacterium]|nr:O-antigen ligase family protein [Gammaproteobacteria bacterium]
MQAIAVVCLAAALPGTFAGASIGFSDHYREIIAELGFLGLLACWLFRNRHTRHGSLTFSWTRLWLGGLLLLGAASAFWAVDLGFFASKYFLWLAAAAALLVTLTVKLDFQAMIHLARGLTLAAAYISTVGLIQVIFDTDIFLQTAPPSANYHNKNAAMQVIVLAFPMIVFLALFEPRKHWSVLCWFAMALVLAYAFHSRTRSAWLSMLVEVAVMAAALVWLRGPLKTAAREGLVNWQTAHKLAVPAALLLAALLVNTTAQGWGGFFSKVSSSTSHLQKEIASYSAPVAKRRAQRYRIWDDTLKMVRENPALGTGMGSFSHNLLTDTEKYEVFAPLRVHNDPLEIGVELGVTGMLLFAASGLGLIACLFRLVRRGNVETRGFFILVTAALAGSAVNMQFSFPYQMPLPAIIFGVFAGLILRAGGGSKVKALALRPYHWYAGLGATGAVFALVLSFNLMWLHTLFASENNIRHHVWNNPISESLPLCHRGIVQLFFRLASAYQEVQRHTESRGVADSLDRCVPNSWMTEQIIIGYLVRNQRWEDAIPVLERAKEHAPLGVYRDYINLVAAYLETGEKAGVDKTYERLAGEPEELLVKQKGTLQALMLFALQADKIEDVKKFYRLAYLHYPKANLFDSKMMPAVRALPEAEAFFAWKAEFDAANSRAP